MDTAWPFALILLIVWWGLAFSKEATIARELKNIKRVQAADFPEGTYGRLVGNIRDGECLTAPLSGKRCVYYSAKIELHGGCGDNSNWETQAHEVQHIPFTMDDGTGAVFVDLEHCRIGAKVDINRRSERGVAPTEVEAAFIARHELTFTEGDSALLCYSESTLEIGEMIAVAGPAVREIDPDPNARGAERGYRDSLPTRVRMIGTASQPLLVSDYSDTLK